MGPSVKFVLPIIDAFPDKIMGVIFCVAKKDAKGGRVSEGVLFFRRNFSRLSLGKFIPKCTNWVGGSTGLGNNPKNTIFIVLRSGSLLLSNLISPPAKF